MEFRHLRYFVTVAECGNITRAAEQLGMEQPPLSQQIKQFEQELGVVLFQRLTRGVQLTEAGSALLDEARVILSLQQQFTAAAQGLALGERGHIRVGLAGAVSLLPIIPRTIRTFREEWPKITLSLEESNTPALAQALHDRSVDVAIVRPPVPQSDHLVINPLLEEPTLVAVPKGHPLAEQGQLGLEMLAQEPFILFPRALGPGFHDAIISACLSCGFSPRMGQEAPQIAAIVPLVAAGLGVAIVPQSLDQIHAEGVTFHKLRDPQPRAELAIATRADAHSSLVRHFVRTFRQACAVPAL